MAVVSGAIRRIRRNGSKLRESEPANVWRLARWGAWMQASRLHYGGGSEGQDELEQIVDLRRTQVLHAAAGLAVMALHE